MIFLQKAFPFIDESLGQVDHSGPGLVDGRGDQIKLSNTKILNAPEWSTLYVPFTIRTVKAWVPNRAIWRKCLFLCKRKCSKRCRPGRPDQFSVFKNPMIDLERLHALVFKPDAIQIAVFMVSQNIVLCVPDAHCSLFQQRFTSTPTWCA